MQRGIETEVKFNGARLKDAQGLLIYGPGITVTSFVATADNQATAKLTVAPDCRLGFYGVRVRTATGISNLLTFAVGALPEVQEVEPNSEFDKPQAVPLGSTVNGVVQNEDVDYFVIDAKKGERITAEVEGLRLGKTTFDPYVAIMNVGRFELAASDDAALLWQDPVASLIAPEDGKYIIQVRESAFGGDGNCRYRLHVGKFPRPRAILPAGGKPGETIDVTALGDAAGPFQAKITLPAEPGNHPFFAQDAGGVAPSANVLRVADLPNVLEVEPNNEAPQATPAVAPGALHGVIDKPGEVDAFKFAAKAGQAFDVRVYARNPLRSPLDSVMRIHRANGAQVGADDDAARPDSYLRFTAPADEEYTLYISDHLKAGGPEYAYRIEIAPVKATLTITIPERQQYIPTTVVVPKGNRMAMMLGASRANFGGELALEFKEMPAGLTVETLAMAANRTDVPVLLTAAADAPVAGSLADVVGKTTDPNLGGLTGHVAQRTMLVRGQNNRDVWGHDAERMAIAVTDAVPFKIDIVQPKVPLVRNGTLNLKIVAQRAEGFAGPINVQMLYNPPGVSSAGNVVIPADKSEITIPLTANAGAEINKWKIVVLGKAASAAGSVECATQLADLEVADTFFNFAFDKAAVEQGKNTDVVVKITQKTPFEGNVQCELVGVPTGVTVEPKEFNKDATELVIPVKVAADARVGRHQTLLVRATVTVNGEPILHTLGTGELRIDAPLPPKVAAPMPAPMPMPAAVAQPAPPMPAPMKRLSRLEQLRLEKEGK